MTEVIDRWYDVLYDAIHYSQRVGVPKYGHRNGGGGCANTPRALPPGARRPAPACVATERRRPGTGPTGQRGCKRRKAITLPDYSSMSTGVAKAINTFCTSHTYRANLPWVKMVTAPKTDLVRQTLAEVLSKLTTTECPDTGDPIFIPISTAPHEGTQLWWGRAGVPLCAAGDECEARAYQPSSLGPLHAYLNPEEQAQFDATGALPSLYLFCLLCIRGNLQGLHECQYGGHASTTATPGGRFMLPPFQNPVDVVGGYKASAIKVSPHAGNRNVVASVVGVSSELRNEYCEIKKRWHVNQDALVYTGQDHLLGMAAATQH
jgi:hypothetical protein